MAEALKKKLRRIAPKQRETLVLALGATRLPVLAFDSVVTCFRERHRAIFEGADSCAIWIVGPTEMLTKRLDV
jgi:hypothetical protein